MNYVDGFVAAVKNARREEYREFAEGTVPMFKEYGALSVVECWGDDVPDGKVTSFPMAVKLEADETVVFSWIIWPDKQAAETGMAASMKQLEGLMGNDMSKMPFDGMRMMWGGFEPIVEM